MAICNALGVHEMWLRGFCDDPNGPEPTVVDPDGTLFEKMAYAEERDRKMGMPYVSEIVDYVSDMPEEQRKRCLDLIRVAYPEE